MTKKMKAKKAIAEALANRDKAIVIDRPGFSPALRCKGITMYMPICPLPWDIFGEIK